jgi:hypothetical protein
MNTDPSPLGARAESCLNLGATIVASALMMLLCIVGKRQASQTLPE